MASDTITLALNGNIRLADFAAVVRNLHELVTALTEEISPDSRTDWVIEDLTYGSAITTVRGESAQGDAVERVVRGYEVVGEALERGNAIPYAPRVAAAAQAITSVLDGHITSIRFETQERDATVVSPSINEVKPPERRAYGAIAGRVQTLTSRRGLRFILYDTLHDHAVSCYLAKGQEEIMRDAWGHRVVVEGIVSRDPTTGAPSTIRGITRVIVKPERAGGWYRQARGALARAPDDPLPETTIRVLRDGE